MSGPTLDGRSILVTRSVDQAAPLVTAIEAAGGRAIVFPALEISDLERRRCRCNGQR